MSLSDDELTAMRERHAKATSYQPGPWKLMVDGGQLAIWDANKHPVAHCGPDTGLFMAAAEADIPRCLDEIADLKRRLAEEEGHTNSYIRLLHKAEKERDEALAKLTEADDKIALRDSAYETMRSWMDQARTEAAVLRRSLQKVEQFCTWLCEDSKKFPQTEAGDAARMERGDIRKAISQPGPGAALLDRVRKLEAVAEAARKVDHSMCYEQPNDYEGWYIVDATDAVRALETALAALQENTQGR